MHYASRFVDPALGFALGWTYWYDWAICIATEVVALGLVIDFWPAGAAVSPAVWITVFLVVIGVTNFINVRIYGEAEFWLSLMKLITLVGLIILGIVITAGGGPNHETIGFRYWREDGAFQQENGIPGAWGRFLAFWTVFLQAAFSFNGTGRTFELALLRCTAYPRLTSRYPPPPMQAPSSSRSPRARRRTRARPCPRRSRPSSTASCSSTSSAPSFSASSSRPTTSSSSTARAARRRPG